MHLSKTAFAFFVLPFLLTGTLARAQVLAKIRKVDDVGNVVHINPPSPSGFPFQWVFQKSNGQEEVQPGPCAEIRFQDPEFQELTELAIMHPNHAVVMNHGPETVVCLNHRNAGFSVHGRLNQKKKRYHYIIDLPFTTPQILLSPECLRMKLRQRTTLKGNYLSVGVVCEPAIPVDQLRTTKILDFMLQSDAMRRRELQIRVPGGDGLTGLRPERIQEKKSITYVATTSTGAHAGELTFDWNGVPEEILPPLPPPPPPTPTPTPVPTATPKKAPPKPKFIFRGLFGAASVSQQLTYSTLVVNNKAGSALQLHAMMDGFWPAQNLKAINVEADGHLELLSGLPQNTYGSVSLQKTLISAPVYDFSAGLGMDGIWMVGAQNYGLAEAFGVMARVRVEAKNHRWAVSGFFGPNVSSKMSLNSNWMNLKSFYRLYFGKTPVEVGLDVNLISVPTSDYGGTMTKYRSVALMFGFMGGR